VAEVVTTSVPAKNPVPTAGELRIAWSRAQRVVQPALPYLRRGAYFGLGLGLAGLALGTLREPPGGEDDERRAQRPVTDLVAQQGEDALQSLRATPAAVRATDTFNERRRTLADRTERAADETHDTIEETYGRLDQLLYDLGQHGVLMLKKIKLYAKAKVDPPRSGARR
jgi:hypothetical protein